MECCNIHDMCYDTCGNNKNVCDMQFQYCLNQRCSQMPSTVTNQVGGYETAPDSRQNGRGMQTVKLTIIYNLDT